MRIRITALVASLACALPAAASNGVIRLDHYVPAAVVTTTTYSCAGQAGGQVDGSVRYTRHRDADGFAGGFEALVFGDVAAGADVLAQANAIVGRKSIEHVSPGCQSDGAVQLLVTLWDSSQPEGRAHSTMQVIRNADGTFVVL
jgi:hypothetical protein